MWIQRPTPNFFPQFTFKINGKNGPIKEDFFFWWKIHDDCTFWDFLPLSEWGLIREHFISLLSITFHLLLNSQQQQHEKTKCRLTIHKLQGCWLICLDRSWWWRFSYIRCCLPVIDKGTMARVYPKVS